MVKSWARIRGVLICALIVWHVDVAGAVPIVYQESVNGDLPEFGTPMLTLALEIGVNTVSGTLGRSVSFVDDFDSFAFTIPNGSQLTAGKIELIDLTGDFIQADWQLHAGSANWNVGTPLQLILAQSPGSEVLTDSLGSGVYNFSHLLIQLGPSSTPESTANYTFILELVPTIPEPFSLELALSGSMTLLAFRRRYACRCGMRLIV